jgi:hypothetical protein
LLALFAPSGPARAPKPPEASAASAILGAVEPQSAEHWAAELALRLGRGLELGRRDIARALYRCGSKRESLELGAWLLERLAECPEAFRSARPSQQARVAHLLEAIRGVGPQTAGAVLSETALERRRALPELSSAEAGTLRQALLERAGAGSPL